jgi:hypothetical protein
MKFSSVLTVSALIISLFSPSSPATAAGVEYKVISEGSSTTPIEIEIRGIAPGKNPFDHKASEVIATITPEGKGSFKTSGYWHQEFMMATQGGVRTTMKVGDPAWRIRFASLASGKQTISVTASIDGAKTILPEFSHTTNYKVVDKVRASGRSFVKGNQPFVPIAYNIAWANRYEEIAKYEQWFSRASKSGVNVARVWMASWSLGIEWTDTGLGDYTKRLDRAWLLDQVFLIAAKHGIGIQLVFINHGAFSTTTNPEWYSNPYNSTNGGPISNAGEFATNATAWQYWERRLHYIVSRYAAYPSLFTWEWWNEVNYTPINSKDLATWIKKSDQVLDQWDPYNTMTTNSWSSGASLENWDNLDYAVTHIYDPSDPIKSLTIQAEALRKAVPDKPILVGEMGSGSVTEDPFTDPRGLHLHNAQWAATFVGFAGPSSYWWWDTYVDPLGLWGHTKGLSQLVSGLDIATMKTDRVLGISQATSLTLSDSSTVLGWVRHNNFDRSAKTQLLLEAAIESLRTKKKIKTTFADPTSKGGKLVLPVSGDGQYIVKTMHTFTGKIFTQKRVTAKDGLLSITIPKFTGDIAFRVDRVVGS